MTLAREPRPPRQGTEGTLLVPVCVLACVAVIPVGLAVTIENYGYDIWGAFIWGPVLLLCCLPLCRWAARRTGDPDVVRFLMAAAVLKVIVGSVLRYASAQAFYGALTDAARYDNAGAELAPFFRRGVFEDLGAISGTRFIEVVSGAVQAVIGDTRMGTFLVFSFFGFVGMVLLYVAFCQALPEGNRRFFRLLLFLTPTIWYWPSSIGKEAIVLLCLGAAVLGAVQLFAGHARGLLLGGLGAWGMTIIRPHMTLVLLAGLLVALPPLDRRTSGRGVGRFLLPLAVVVALPLVVGQVEKFFSIDSLNADSAESVRVTVERQTGQGGSAFSVPDTQSPWGLVVGVVTVVSRPFPWEADGVTTALSAVEIAALTLLFLRRALPNPTALVRSLRHRLPRLAAGYALAFCVVFAAVGNFGILVRQRSLLLPMLFVILAAAPRRPVAGDDPQPDATTTTEPVGVA